MRAIALATAAALLSACASTSYTPQLVARGEITLRYQDGFQAWAGGREVAHGITWGGLERTVRCVPEAAQRAAGARAAGGGAVLFSILGGVLGVGGLGVGLVAPFDAQDHHDLYWLAGGVATAAVGLLFAGLSRLERNIANGKAVDAINFYNDAVGSLGATCDDLRFPPPAGPAPQAPPPGYPPPGYPPPGYPPPSYPPYPPPAYPQ